MNANLNVKKTMGQVEVINKDNNSLFMERETGVTHSPFNKELLIFKSIQSGNVKEVQRHAEDYIKDGITMGNLSSNSVRQLRYWAVSTIAVAIHYSILGGLDETDAFNLSDEYIRRIDELNDMEEIVYYLMEKAIDLTYAVYNSKANQATTMPVRKCIHYIHVHLHEKINVDDLAKECNLSRNYLSILFKKEIGESIHSYINREKLAAAKTMLREGISSSDIAYQLSFCSESHFILCFKKEFGITPGDFIKEEKC